MSDMVDRDKGSYGSPGGSATRAGREMIAPLMQFAFDVEIDSLRAEPEYESGDRNSRTLAKETDLRVLLTVLRAGAALDEQQGDARTTVQVVDGVATIELDGEQTSLSQGQLAVVDRGAPWLVVAQTDCAVLLTIAFPPEKAGV
jgi:quercetin dioxygenase-like cupin family protein